MGSLPLRIPWATSFNMLAEKGSRREDVFHAFLDHESHCAPPTVIHGWFEEQGKPYVLRLWLRCRGRRNTQWVRLLVDTGADATVTLSQVLQRTARIAFLAMSVKRRE